MELLKELTQDGYLFSTDKTKLDIPYVHEFLSQKSYWAHSIPHAVVKLSIENSLCFGVYKDNKQIGFARMVTDYATFGYLADVFIDESYRRKGISKIMMEFIFGMDEWNGLRRLVLATRDAHSLYSQYDFKPLASPDKFMEIHRSGVYTHTSKH